MELRPILSALSRNKTGPLLLVMQVAISLAILVNMLFVVKSYMASAARPSGVSEYANLFHMGIRHPKQEDKDRQIAIKRNELAILRALPGVKAVAAANVLPLMSATLFQPIQTTTKGDDNQTYAAVYRVADSVIDTWGLKLVEGRDFRPEEVSEQDMTDLNNPNVAIITRAFAAGLFPNDASAIGKTVYLPANGMLNPARIVGVVDHLITPKAPNDAWSEYSLLVPRLDYGGLEWLYSVRTEPGQRDRITRDAEQALRAANTVTPAVVRSFTMESTHEERYRSETGMIITLITISILLLLITASGIVGMVSLWVNQRRKQIGVRRALGARRIDILRYFLTENLIITGIGIAAGLPLAIGLNIFLVKQFEMPALPVAYLALGSLIFLSLGIIATLTPAWRGASISPAVATRSA